MGWFFPSREPYLSYILIAFFNVLCSTNNQLMNAVYLRFLSWEVRWKIIWCATFCSKHCVICTEQETQGTQLTCWRTFSAKISWSREISTTFPSICLAGTKQRHEISHENSVPSIFKPFQMALLLPRQLWCFSPQDQRNFVPSGTNMPVILSR